VAQSASVPTAVLSLVATAVDDCDRNPTLNAADLIAYGGTFPMGTTTVTLTATDNQSRTGTGILTIVVTPASDMPSSQPSVIPSSQPSNLPSEQPSISGQPSISEQPSKPPVLTLAVPLAYIATPVQNVPIVIGFGGTVGSVSLSLDVCSMSADLVATFGVAVIDTVDQVAECTKEAGCNTEVLQLCGNGARRGLRSSSRHLSSRPRFDDYMVNFEITQSFKCVSANCDSPSDVATVMSLLAVRVDIIQASLTSDFLAGLLANMIKSGKFTADTLKCLSLWGHISEPYSGIAGTDRNAEQLSLYGSQQGRGGGTGVYYPDWESHTGTCLQDGNQPMYMQLMPDVWLYADLTSCCDRYFPGWHFNKCLNKPGTGLWYVDYKNEKCVTDCEVGQGPFCGGHQNPVDDDLYENPSLCCKSKLPWVYLPFCEAEAFKRSCYEGTRTWYRGYHTSNVCVMDCDPVATGDASCGGYIENTFIVVHKTPEECCSTEYNWMTHELCVARAKLTNSNVYWPDRTNAKCFQDSETPALELSVPVYSSIVDCCKASIDWLPEHECLTASGNSTAATATTKFFVDWNNVQCVQDSEGTDKPPKFYDELFDSLAECCERIPWVRKVCLATGSRTVA